MKEFARAILSKQEDRLNCNDCEERLAEYVHAQVMGIEPGEDFAAIGLHLGFCPHCAQAYHELMALTTAAYTGETPQPACQPQFDFSFLKTETGKYFWWDELGRLIVELSAELLRGLQPPDFQPAYSGVKSGRSPGTLWQLPVAAAAQDLEVTISAEATPDDPAQCTVVVEVNVPSRGGWPNLAGTEVSLKPGEQEPEIQATDAFGKAVFEGIGTGSLPYLVFEITLHP